MSAPTRFAAARRRGLRGRDVEHAVADADTLCGLPRRTVTVYRHLFRPDADDACPACRDAAQR